MRATEALRRADAEARRAALVEWRRPLVIEAGAGTGKTATLVARIVAWALGPGWERAEAQLPGAEPVRLAGRVLGRVAAITFTEAAAAEMAGRVGEALAAVRAGEPVRGLDDDVLPANPERRLRRASALLAALDELEVRTIHAWCRRQLARFPVEAGLHPLFEVDADGSLREEIAREQLERALHEALVGDADHPLWRLSARGLGAEAVLAALLALLEGDVSAEDLARDPYAPECLSVLLERVAAAASELEQRGAALASVGAKSKSTLAAWRALAETRELAAAGVPEGRPAVVALCEAFGDLWQDGAGKALARWGQKFNVTETKALGDSLAEALEAARALEAALRPLRGAQVGLFDEARAALGPLLRNVRRELERRGVLGFGDLLARTDDLLEARPEVRALLRRELDLLLVDEFQDTDPIQCRIVEGLALTGAPAPGLPGEPAPALFVVGDPKQSIYGWRSADLAAYEAFVTRVEQAGGRRLPLAINHRSASAILAEVERVIAPVMQREAALQPPFEPLLPCDARLAHEEELAPPRSRVEHWLSWPRDEQAGGLVLAPRASEATGVEARAFAADVAALRRAHPELELGRVALLLRSTTDVERYLRALREADIPYTVGRDRQYFRRREVADAAAALRCLLEPHDQLALLTFLRSPMVGVPDAALLPLWQAGLPPKLAALEGPDPASLAEIRQCIEDARKRVPADVPYTGTLSDPDAGGDWSDVLCGAIESLALLRASAARDPADLFVERLRRLWLPEPLEAARFLGPYRVANLERFFRELAGELVRGADVQALLRRLRRDIAGRRDAEEARLEDPGGDAVRVMTIHAAKGLSFQHVYLGQLQKASAGRRGSPPPAEVGRGPGGVELALFGARSPGFHAEAARRARVEAAERVRLLYVALTRAEERVVTLGAWPAAPGASAGEPLAAGSLLDLLCARRDTPADLEAAAQACLAADDPDGFEAGGARFRLAARIAELRAESGGAPARGAFDLEHALASARRWSELEEPARARMARPFSRRASAPDHELEGEPENAEARERRAWAQLGDEEDAAADAEAPRSAWVAEPARSSAAAGSDEAQSPALASARRRATAVGTAVHAALEQWDWSQPAERACAAQCEALAARVAGLLPEPERAPAVEAARDLLQRFAAGPLCTRLEALAPEVVARELPIWSEPDDPERGAVLFESGAIDLVYRDPETGELVVADYKTDRVTSERDAADLRARYAGQGRSYTRALQRALSLPAPPRFELWLLAADRIEEVPHE